MPRKGTKKRARPSDMIRVGDSEEIRLAVKRALQIRQVELPVFYLGTPALSQPKQETHHLEVEKNTTTELLGESRASSQIGSPLRGASMEREFSPSDFLVDDARNTLSQLQSTEWDSLRCDETIEEAFFDYEPKTEVIMTFGEQPGSIARAAKPIFDHD
jgi:hypothetical protein